MTTTHVLAVFFGGPDDGATMLLTAEDVARGFVDTQDSEGATVRHSIVVLPEPKQLDDIVATHELRPTEGVW